MTLTPEQLQRLPKYARWEIERLERDLADERARLVDLGDQSDDVYPLIEVDPYSEQPIKFSGKTSLAVRFGERHEDRVNLRIRDGWIELSGGERLIIRPHASNVVHVRPTKWREKL